MGTYLNPGNQGFRVIRNDLYIDKSGLISLINGTIDTPRRLTCISRPRRFGKSFAAQMLCAYYDKTCDSSSLFDDLAIAAGGNEACKTYRNSFDVIYLDITNIMGEAGSEEITAFIRRKVTEELIDAYPGLKTDESFSTTLINAAELTGNKFIAIIDEWDAPIRETPAVQKQYLAAKSLMDYISLNFDGLSATLAKLLGGIDVPVDTNDFANDLVTFQNQDDVLGTNPQKVRSARSGKKDIRPLSPAMVAAFC